MTTCEKIFTLSQQLPESLQEETLDFIEFLTLRARKKQIGKSSKVIQAGSARGKVKMTPDFDAPLEDFEEYMT